MKDGVHCDFYEIIRGKVQDRIIDSLKAVE
jgi:hypothetical protein